ncbi:MAG: beta-propeller fold lactonase family protein [Kiritimatiellia bacterium]
MSASPVRFLVGSYNRPGPYFHATGEGLAEYRLDPATGEIRRVARIEGADNTTYLAAVPGGFVAACDCYLDAGRVAAFQSSADGVWMRGPQRETGGGAVCHVGFDPVSHLVFVTAYLDGITVHRFDPVSGIAPYHQAVAYRVPAPGWTGRSDPIPIRPSRAMEVFGFRIWAATGSGGTRSPTIPPEQGSDPPRGS